MEFEYLPRADVVVTVLHALFRLSTFLLLTSVVYVAVQADKPLPGTFSRVFAADPPVQGLVDLVTVKLTCCFYLSWEMAICRFVHK